MTADLADAGDQSVGGRALDELLHLPPPPLGGDDQRPVFDEGPRIAQILDALPRRALSRLPPPSDSVGPPRIRADRMPLDRVGEGVTHARTDDFRSRLRFTLYVSLVERA